MKLISMTDFFLSQESKWKKETEGLYPTLRKYKDVVLIAYNYANFLKEPLELWMFVPCDFNGNFLISIGDKEQYLRDCYDGGWWNQFVDYKVKYQEAKDRILFEGFEFTVTLGDRFSKWKISNGNITFYEAGLKLSNVESMIQKVEIILTKNCVKKLGI